MIAMPRGIPVVVLASALALSAAAAEPAAEKPKFAPNPKLDLADNAYVFIAGRKTWAYRWKK